MPMCGFNKKMLKGLAKYNENLLEERIMPLCGFNKKINGLYPLRNGVLTIAAFKSRFLIPTRIPVPGAE